MSASEWRPNDIEMSASPDSEVRPLGSGPTSTFSVEAHQASFDARISPGLFDVASLIVILRCQVRRESRATASSKAMADTSRGSSDGAAVLDVKSVHINTGFPWSCSCWKIIE